MRKIPYIIVYGRENCSACKTVKRRLSDTQVVYVYKDMTDESVRSEVYSRMERAGMDTKKFLIPVIDVNGSLAIRPNFRDLLYRYGHPSPEDHSAVKDSSDPACKEVGANPSNCSEKTR